MCFYVSYSYQHDKLLSYSTSAMCIVQLNKGCRVDKDNGNGMKIEEFLSQTDDREGNNDKKVRFITISIHLRMKSNLAAS